MSGSGEVPWKTTQDLLDEACADKMRLREELRQARGAEAALRQELDAVQASAGRELAWLRRRVAGLERAVRAKHADLSKLVPAEAGEQR